ncbi:MAG: hypothetical protein ACE15B_10705 [Bryobacteraceae bacterium]
MRLGRRGAVLYLVCAATWAQQKPAGEMERAVEEFKIQTRNLGLRADSPAKARQARGAGRAWHGRLYENFRNDALDAVPHEILQRGADKSVLRRNQFGFNVAGPAAAPRLPSGNSAFFSLSYEGVRERISRASLRTIPTAQERTGDYSAIVDQAGGMLPIYDPAATRENPEFDPARPVSTDNLQHAREPFPGNIIPAARLDPEARRITGFYPLPNTSVGPFFRNNFFVNSPETNTANGMIGKLDQTLLERHRASLELAFSNGSLGAARLFPNAANPGASDRHFSSRRGSLEHVFTASPRTVNTIGFDVSSDSSRNGAEGEEPFPVISFSPYLGMGRAYPVSRTARNNFTWTESLSTRRGKHTVRLTAQYSRQQVNTFWPQYPAGSLRFGAGLTSLPGIVNTGHAFASFLLGMAEYAESSVAPAPSYFRRTHGTLALNDRWEMRRGLTISVGANLERSTPRVEKYDRQSTVALDAVNPANGRLGALVAAARGGHGRSFQPVRVRLEPHASLAWNPRGDANTVVRAAFARSYAAIPIYSAQWGTQGFAAYPTFISPNVQLEPAVRLSGGLPPLGYTLPNLAATAANDTVADLIDATDRQPTYQSASLTLERQLPASVVLTAGVAYSGGKNLLVGNGAANPNAIPLDALRFRDLLNDENFNRSLRPYPQYKGFDVYSSYPLGRYERDAAFLRMEKRASGGLTVSAYYEFARQMDDYSGPYGKQDFFNRRNEWSRTVGPRPHYFQFSYTYDLPLNPGRFRTLARGWSVTGSASMASGDPLYLRPQFNNTGGVVQALRVNAVAGVDPHVAGRGPELWFNPAAFDQPPDFTLGAVSRTLPDVFNPGYQNYDVSVNKRFALAPDRALEFSAAGFNFLNHANWNDPDNVIGPASAPNVNAGKIIGSSGGRVIQLGLRFSF